MAGSGRVRPIIMCGGSGTRLWPASRDSLPKQFIPLIDGVSTFMRTLERVSGPDYLPPVVITGAGERFIVAEQLAQAGIGAEILLEPERRDSAAAIAVAALHCAAKDEEEVLLILAADHLIPDSEAFAAAARTALAATRTGYIMTLGVAPTGPAVTYGYILKGEPIEGGAGALRVARFVEKPNETRAKTLLEEGALWNSGCFMTRADVMIAELRSYAPEVVVATGEALEKAQRDLDFIRLDPASFGAAPKLSIDYAVMEKTERAGVLPVTFAWSDIGTWGSLRKASGQDGNGNALQGRVRVKDTRNSLVMSQGDVLTTVVGLDDVVVVSTPDAVLVTSTAGSDAVKGLVADLAAEGLPEAREHLRMYRPWGWYQRIDAGTRFQVKRISVHPGGRLSLQKHYHRAEHWVVVRGTAEVTIDDRIVLVHENEAVYLPIGCTHRLANPGRIPLELIEVQVGSYTGEDDIVRLDDVYGRSSES